MNGTTVRGWKMLLQYTGNSFNLPKWPTWSACLIRISINRSPLVGHWFLCSSKADLLLIV